MSSRGKHGRNLGNCLASCASGVYIFLLKQKVEVEIIREPDLKPAQVTELAVAAESYAIRALWHSNYHAHRDPFVTLVAAAMATKKILLGVLAVSPYELHRHDH